MNTLGFQRGLKQVQGGLDKLTSGIGGLVKAGLAIAGISVGLKAIGESIKALNDQTIQETKLATVMKTRMAATDGVIKSVKELASAEQKLGVISSDVQISGAAELATYLEQADSLKKLIPAMNDLIATQYGTEASTQSAMNVATMMGKVISGDTGALSRYGFSFTEAQKRIFEYGTETEKAAELSKIFNVEIGKVNHALGRTPAGAMKQLANSFDDLRVNIGRVFEPIVMKILPALNQMVATLTEVFNRLAAIVSLVTGYKSVTAEAAASMVAGADGAHDMADGLEEAGKAQKKLAAGFDELNIITKSSDSSSSTELAGGIGGGAGFGGLDEFKEAEQLEFAWLDKLNEKLEPTRLALQQLGEALEPFKNFVAQGVEDFYNNFLVPVGNWILGEGLPGFLGIITDLVQNIDWEKLTQSTGAFWGALSNYFTNVVFTSLLDFFENFLKPLQIWSADAFMRFVDATTEFLNNTDWEPLLEALNRLWKALEPFAINVGEGLLWFYTDVVLPLGKWAMEDLIPTALDLISAAFEALNTVIDILKPGAVWIWENWLVPLGEWTGGIIIKALESITSLLNKFSDWAKENPDKIEALAIVIGSFAAAWALVNAAIAIWNVIGVIATGVTGAFGTAVAILTSPITLVIAAIAAIIAIIALLIKNWDKVKEVATNVWNKVKEIWNGFATWFDEKVWEPFKKGLKTVGNFFIDIWNGVVNAFETALNWIIKGINKFITVVNKLLGGASDLLSLAGFDVNLKLATISEVSFGRVPHLASGGILDSPTAAILGEYPGAKSNPEIAAPQSLIYETVVSANKELVAAFYQIADKIINAIEDNKTEVSIGDDDIAKSAARGNDNWRKRTGKSLI